MSKMKVAFFATLVSLAFLLTACGGGGSSSGTNPEVPESPGGSAGVAVDPYIVGAVFKELDSDGEIIQTSTPSGTDGAFTFAAKLTQGNLVVMSVQGLHNGLPFKGTLKRVVGSEEETVVVSPLTTLVAEGNTPAQVVGILQTAGIEITEADIIKDPMAVLAEKPELVIAAIAVNTVLTSNADPETALDSVVQTLNKVKVEGEDITEDQISTAVVLSNYMVDQAEEAVRDEVSADEALNTAAGELTTEVISSVSEAVSDPNNDVVVLDDSGGSLAPATGSIQEYLNAAFAALEGNPDDPNGPSTATLLDAVDNFQKASALVGVDTDASQALQDEALFFGSLTHLAILADPYSDLTDNGLNNLGDIFDAFGLAGTNAERTYFDLIQIENCVDVLVYTDPSGVEYWEQDCTLPDLPADSPTSGELKQALAQKLSAALDAAIEDLGKISTSFNKVWLDSVDESATEFDYSDALFFKGIAQAMLVELNLLQAYNFDIDIDALQRAETENPEMTPESFLADHPALGSLVSQENLTAAKTYIGQSVDTLKSAVTAIDAEYKGTDNVQEDDLISFYSCDWNWDSNQYVCDHNAEEVTSTLEALTEIKNALSAGVTVDDNGTATTSDDIVMDFYKFFDGFDIREQLPPVTDEMAGNFPDPTLNGIVDPQQVDINEDRDGDGYPDLVNDYTFFFSGMISGQQPSAYFGWENGYASEQFSFSAEGNSFTYRWDMQDFGPNVLEPYTSAEGSGSWEIVNGDLILTFVAPIDSWRSDGQMDTIVIDLLHGGDEWADVSENHYLQNVPVQADPIEANWGFGYGGGDPAQMQ